MIDINMGIALFFMSTMGSAGVFAIANKLPKIKDLVNLVH